MLSSKLRVWPSGSFGIHTFKSYLSWFHTSFLSLCDKDVLFGLSLKNGHTLPPFICSLFSESPPFTFWTDKTVRLTPQAMRSGQTGQTVSRASRTMLALPEIDT